MKFDRGEDLARQVRVEIPDWAIGDPDVSLNEQTQVLDSQQIATPVEGAIGLTALAKTQTRREIERLGPRLALEWHDRANCKGVGDDAIFFPKSSFANPKEARVFCTNCQVKEECLDQALNNGELGVWGGMSEVERRAYLARRRGH